MRIPRSAILTLAALFSIPFAAFAVGASDSSSASPPAQNQEPSNFSIVVNTTGAGIVATCKEGCAWETVSAKYPGGTYRITQRGIEPANQPRESSAQAQTDPSGFSFVLTTKRKGIQATCDEGCAWRTLSGANSQGTYRITEQGITTGHRKAGSDSNGQASGHF